MLVDDPASVYDVARGLADESGGHYLDQFTYAERATDWRGNNNIAESIFEQLSMERFPEPQWVVVGAGTGGTSATIGRYVRYRGLATRLCVVDPENSAFLAAFRDPACGETTCGSRIEGIGRPRAEPSFLPDLVDRMVQVPDAASVAAVHFLRARTGAARRAVDRHRAVRRDQAGLRHAGRRGGRARSSRCSATTGSATSTPTSPTPGSRRRAGTSRRTSPSSPAPGTTGCGRADPHRSCRRTRSGIRDVRTARVVDRGDRRRGGLAP